MRSIVAIHLQFIARQKASQAVGLTTGTVPTALSYGDTKINKEKEQAFLALFFVLARK